MKKNILVIAGIFYIVFTSSLIAREGWCFDFTTGLNAHFGFDEVENNFPNGIKTHSEVALLNELDIGYSFKKHLHLDWVLSLTILLISDINWILNGHF